MILIIKTNKEKLHDLEFVRPIEDIVGKDFFTKHYSEVSGEDLEKCSHVIICGTSLKDFEFVKDFEKFSWLKNFEKPVLGICAGMQILGLVFGCNVGKMNEIGFGKINFEKEFLGLIREQKIYELHNYSLKNVDEKFEIYAESATGTQAIKHKTKPFYGILFHPEVRQKELVREFLGLK